MQDLAAQLASPLLNLEDGQKVLDTCAAPGGKSAHIKDLAKVALTSCDIDEKRLESTEKTFKRLGIEAKLVAIVIRRHPDIKWLRRQKDIETLVNTQALILDNAFSKLKQGGILVFTTCSILKRENIEQVEKFLARHSDAKLLPFKMNGTEVETYQRLPGENNSDGFFYARFVKE